MNKKLISAFLAAVILCGSLPVFAAPTDVKTTEPAPTTSSSAAPEESLAPQETELPTELVSEAPSAAAPTVNPAVQSRVVKLEVIIDPIDLIAPTTVWFELFDTNGVQVGYDSQPINADTKELHFTFNVPEYTLGKSFVLKCTAGLDKVKYYDDSFAINQEISFNTYYYANDDGQLVTSDGISVNATPQAAKVVPIAYDNVPVNMNPPAILIGNTTMVPLSALAQYIGLDAEYNSEYNVEIISLGDDKMYFNLDTAYTTVFGTDTYAVLPTIKIKGTVYAALRTFADAIGSEITVNPAGPLSGVNLAASAMVNNYFNQLPVNQWGIASRTNYMVWVSKHEYKVRVYKGKQYQWKQVYSAPCALGAPGTPTITGSFEYKYTDRWNYADHYVGPCLVFYGGYALHSVLLRYDNTEYDGRTGVQISHGCIRLKKKDIDWIYNTIPIGTRIHITE